MDSHRQLALPSLWAYLFLLSTCMSSCFDSSWPKIKPLGIRKSKPYKKWRGGKERERRGGQQSLLNFCPLAFCPVQKIINAPIFFFFLQTLPTLAKNERPFVALAPLSYRTQGTFFFGSLFQCSTDRSRTCLTSLSSLSGQICHSHRGKEDTKKEC